jgi:hypothetical protein
MTKARFWNVGTKLASVARYACSHYPLRHRSVRCEEKKLNPVLSGYPRNHDYTIKNGRLVPGFKLFERSRLISPLLPPEMDSFLDVGCCRGFYVLEAARRPGCLLAVGVDVHEPFLQVSNEARQCIGLDNALFSLKTLAELAADPAAVGGPFHTILNIGTYHYLYWGSGLCSTAYYDHKTILGHFASLCTHQLIISARFEIDCLPKALQVSEQNEERRRNYTTSAFMEAASELFEVEHKGFLGAYPLLRLQKK